MKKCLLFTLLLVSVLSLSAQFELNLWDNLRVSAVTEDETVVFKCQTINPLLQTELYFTTETGWDSQILEIASPIQPFTFQTEFAALTNEIQNCRLWTEVEVTQDTSIVFTMPAYFENDNMANDFNNFGFVMDDPIGDCIIPDASQLDIVKLSSAFSDDRFYSVVSNDTGTFPTSAGFMGPFYFYINAIMNPESGVTDSVAFAMIYGEIPYLFDAGLYKITGESIEDFEQIGDIESENIDGNLVLSCNFDDLINDPDFGEWPSLSNTIASGLVTMEVNLSGDASIADMGGQSILWMEEFSMDNSQNSLPELSEINYTTIANTTSFELYYYDADGNFPLTAEITLDGIDTIEMIPDSYSFEEPNRFSVVYLSDWDTAVIRFSDNNIDFVEETIGTTAYTYGDVDENGNIQAFDASITLQYIVGLDPLPTIDPRPWEEWRMTTADVDGNGSLQAYDASLILQYVVGLITVFPVEESRIIAPLAKVNIDSNDGELVFYSEGNLFGFEVELPQGIAETCEIITDYQYEYFDGKLALCSATEISDKFLQINYHCSEKINTDLKMVVNVESSKLNIILNNTDAPINIYGSLVGNFPNPFNPKTKIVLNINQENVPVCIDIYNIKGEIISSIFKGNLNQGIRQFIWNGTDINNNKVSSGMYFIRANIGKEVQNHKMILLK